MNMQKFKKISILCCISALLAWPRQITALASVPGTTNDNQTEAEAFVRDFYETISMEDLAALHDMTDSSADTHDLHKFLANWKALFDVGFQRYDNVVTTVYPLSDENYQIVLVQYDMFFEDIDTGFPGSSTELAHKQENGQWGIFPSSSSFEDLQLFDEIVQVTGSDEIIAITKEVMDKYNDVLLSDSSIIPWLSDMSNELNALTGSYLQEDFDSFLNTYIGNGSSCQEGPDSYTVRKGDCLWRIAETELGDGMLWHKLYEKNRETIGDDPDLLLTGSLLQL